MSLPWRVFISYRSNSEYMDFTDALYKYLTEDPLCDKKYGKIYYSPYTKTAEVNFKKDIPTLMKRVEYFVMPLTENYYEGFWDKKNDCPNINSITYLEILEAIKNNCRFICVAFPGFDVDRDLLINLFGSNADALLCVAPIQFNASHTDDILRKIGDIVVSANYSVRGMADLLKSTTPNVYMSFKNETENHALFPFYERLYDIKRITLMNYAASSFISGIDIASIYEDSNYLKRWFHYHLTKGNIEANIILTNPYCSAAQDASTYKMYPRGLTISKDNIILKNMNALCEFVKNVPDTKLNLYLTNIALPYGVMILEHRNPANNHIKVDLYAAVTNDDGRRPSFYLLKNNPKTSALYSFFEENVANIMNNYSYQFKGHPDTEWLTKTHIIHRGVISRGLNPHTKGAYDACIQDKFPIEVDLFTLNDGTIVVGRAEQIVYSENTHKQLSNCNRNDLRKNNDTHPDNTIFTLEEFLQYVNGQIPILIEIKVPHSPEIFEPTLETKEQVIYVLEKIQDYLQRCASKHITNPSLSLNKVAIHSSDPYVLKIIKHSDCMIPCGQISMDFSALQSTVGRDFYEMHKTAKFLEIVEPDFISYKVEDLHNGIAKRICKERNIPLLGWTVLNESSQLDAYDLGCNNIIIEESKDYLYSCNK